MGPIVSVTTIQLTKAVLDNIQTNEPADAPVKLQNRPLARFGL